MASVKFLAKSTNPRARKPFTLRFWDTKGQHEISFRTAAERKDWAVKFEHDSRLQIFVDPRAGSIPFTEAATAYIERASMTEGSKANLRTILSAHVAPWAGTRTLAQVAQDREGVQDLLLKVMPAKVGASRVGVARTLITSVVAEGVKAGRIPANHRLADIEIPTPRKHTEEFTFATHAQLEHIAGRLPAGLELIVWLIRGLGLRPSEALAVNLKNFRDHGKTYRVREQVARDAEGTCPLKHRNEGEYRDVPCPRWLWVKVQEHVTRYGLPIDGYLFPGRRSKRFVSYPTFLTSFQRAASGVQGAGLPRGFGPHQLRHAYASAMLSALVPLSDVSKWLGHRDFNITFNTYGHLLPDAWDRGRAALEAEFEQWSQAA